MASCSVAILNSSTTPHMSTNSTTVVHTGHTVLINNSISSIRTTNSILASTTKIPFNSVSLLASLMLNLFGSNLTTNVTRLLSILSTQTEYLNGCLSNCSSNGICHFNSNAATIGCNCFQNYAGTSCQTDIRPCALNSCLNNSTCVNNSNDTFKCECQNNYFGLNCERFVDLCQNVTCMKHGYCYINQTRAKCKCFTSYSGDECEIESTHVRLVKSVQWTSTLICFVSFGLSIILAILNDIWNYFIRTKAKNGKTQKTKPKKIEQFKYHP